MASVRAFRSGNWSDTNPATSPWGTGGVLYAPAAGDDVWSNTYTITVDNSPSVGSVHNGAATSRLFKDGATTTTTAGGNFDMSTGQTLTLTGLGVCTGATSCITVANAVSCNINTTDINATYYNTGAYNGVLFSSSGTLTIVASGRVTAGWSGSAGVQVTGSGTLNLTSSTGINPTSYNSAGVIIAASSSGNINITGNVGDTGYGTYIAISHSGTGTLTITGNVYGAVAGNNTVLLGGNGNVTIIGNLYGGNSSTGYALGTSYSGTYRITGILNASNSAYCINSTNTAASLIFSGNWICSSNGHVPVNAPIVTWLNSDTSTTSITFRTSTGASRTFSTPGGASGYPLASNTRNGIQYGPNLNDYTGTMTVPPVSSVAAGVSYDGGTLGTAVITTDTLMAIMGAQLAAAMAQ